MALPVQAEFLIRTALLLVTLAACSSAPPPAPAGPPPAPVTAAPPPQRVAPRKPVDDGMSVAGVMGTLDESQIQAPFRARWRDVTTCIDGVRKSKPYVGGQLELKVRVSKEGRARQVVLMNTIGSRDVERCLLWIVRTFAWDRPSGGADAEFTYPIEIQRRHGVVEWAEGAIKPAKLHKLKHKISPCKGRGAVLSMYVGPGGRVVSAGVANVDDDTAACLVDKALEAAMPDPMGAVALLTLTL